MIFWCTTQTLEEHIDHLCFVFDLLREHQIYAKESKFSFAKDIIDYLGHCWET